MVAIVPFAVMPAHPSFAVAPSVDPVETIAAPASLAVGTTGTVTVTVSTGVGSTMLSGSTIELRPSSPLVTVSAPVATNASGQAAFSIVDHTMESVTFTAIDLTDNLTLAETASTLFYEPGVPVAATSNVTAPGSVPVDNPPVTPPPSGTVSVHVLDGGGSGVAGQSVTLGTTSSTATVTPSTAVTDGTGTATFTVSDTAVEVATFTASDTTLGMQIPAPAKISFYTPGAPSIVASSVVPADPYGSTSSADSVAVTVLDGGGAAISGATVSCKVTTTGAGTPTCTAPAATNASGATSFTVSDTTAETDTVVVTVATTPAVVLSPATITFVANPTAVSAANSSVTLSSTSAPVSNAYGVLVTVDSLDLNGNPVATVPTVTASSTNATVAQVGSVVSGVSQWRVTDAAPESVQISVSSGATAFTAPPAILFYASNEPLTSTITSTATSAPADGVSTVTVTVTLLAGTTPIAGDTVALGGSSTLGATPVGGSAVTNSSGVVQFTVSDSVAEGVNVTATDTTTGLQIDAVLGLTFYTVGEAADSTVVANASSLPADGTSSTVVTVTLESASGPIRGHQVTLGDGKDANVTISPATATTSYTGTAVFTVSASFPGAVTFTATDVSGGVQIAQSTTISFLPGPLSQANSMVTASPTTVTADGTSQSTVTVVLEDANGHPISGKAVSLAASVGTTPTIAPQLPGSSTTNAAGAAVFVVSDSTVENTTLTATDVTDGIQLASTATVDFVPGQPSSSQSTITAQNPTTLADGATTDTITVTVKDSSGHPVTGLLTNLIAQSGHSVIAPASSGSDTTNSSGVATYVVTDAVVETVGYTALASGTSLSVSGGTVQFVAGPPSAALSTITLSATSVPASTGSSTATVTVVAKDAYGHVLPGATVALTGTPSGTIVITPSSGEPASASGVATFTVSDKTPESVSLVAKITQGSTATLPGAGIVFTGTPTAANSSAVAAPTSVPAGGVSVSTITVTLKDANGNPVSGQSVSLTAQNGSSKITGNQSGGVSGPSDQNGQVTFTVSDLQVEQVRYSVTDITTGLTLGSQPTVTFTGQPSTSTSTVVASPQSVQANGTASTTVTVTLKDAIGNPVSGKSVFLAADNLSSGTVSGANVTTVQGITDSNGVATFTATDTNIENIVFVATDTTDAIELVSTASAQVAFTAAPTEASNSTISAVPSVANADGTSAAVVTVTLLDGGGNPVSGATVGLTQLSADHARLPLPTPTNSSGVATFSVTDLVAETVQLGAVDQTNNVTISRTASVTFTPSASEASDSTVVATPTSVSANGVAAATVTVTLKDVNGNPIAGDAVTLAASAGTSPVITGPSPALSPANGVVTFTVTDTVVESVTLTATDTTTNIPVNQTATVAFVAPPTEASTSTVVAAPPAAPVGGISTIDVTLRSATGSVIVGDTVSLAVNGGSSATVTAVRATTDVTGQAVFTVTDPVVETVTLTATDVTTSTTIAELATVVFQAVSYEAADSTLSAAPATVPADGTTPSVVTVTLLDGATPLSGHAVVLFQQGAGSARIEVNQAATDASGVATFDVTDVQAETVTFAAFDQTTGITVQATVQVTFSANSLEQFASTVTAAPPTAPNDGATPATITVTLQSNGTPIAGHSVSLSIPPTDHALVSPPSAVTDSNGVATFSAVDGSAEAVTLTATDTTDGLVLLTTATVTYAVPVPAVVSLSPTSGPTAGGTSVTITGTGFEAGDTVHFGTGNSGTVVSVSPTSIVATTPALPLGAPTQTVDVVVSGAGGSSAVVTGDRFTFVNPAPPPSHDCVSHLPTGTVVGMAATVDGAGYWVVDQAGDVAAFGDAVCYGALTGTSLASPIVGVAADYLTGGYWMVARNGTVHAFNAPNLGSAAAGALHAPVVAIEAASSGLGYRMASADGNVLSFGVSTSFGSMAGHSLNKPVVGLAATPSDKGYWLVASDGGIFAFGDARFYGSTGNIHLNQPIVGMSPDLATGGYWLVAADGGIFSFDARFFGSTGNITLNKPIVGMTPLTDGQGYRFVATDGGIFDFGAAKFYGSAV